MEALEAPTIQTWKTIRLGVHKTADEYRKAMKSAKNKVGDGVGELLGNAKFTCATEETDVDLVVLSGAELDFKESAEYSDICARALELGLELCPAEVGPALRLAYKDQPRGEWLIIAMKAITDSAMNAITDSDGDLVTFNVGHVGNFSDLRFVFVRRK